MNEQINEKRKTSLLARIKTEAVTASRPNNTVAYFSLLYLFPGELSAMGQLSSTLSLREEFLACISPPPPRALSVW